MWQRGTLGTYVWKHVICTGQCYHRNAEYIQEGTCIPARKQNCPSHLLRYRKFLEVELRSLRQNISSLQRCTAAPWTANGSTAWTCPTVSNSCKVYRYQPPTFRFAVDVRCPFTRPSGIKGKAFPLQAWSGTDGSRKLRFPDFMTTAQDGGKVVSIKHRPPLPPGNKPDTHFS